MRFCHQIDDLRADAAQRQGCRCSAGSQSHRRYSSVDHDLETLENVANQAVSAIENARLYENIQKVYLSTIEVLATAIDAKDPYTQGHSRRVTQYSVAIAEELNLTPKEVESIRYAGLLHDVGKIGIKDSIIRKPGRLTDEEYAIIKKHPAIGAKILRPVDFLADKIPGCCITTNIMMVAATLNTSPVKIFRSPAA